MARTIIVDGGEKIACPKCNHGFPLSEGISRQTIERYAADFDSALHDISSPGGKVGRRAAGAEAAIGFR